MHLNAGLSPLFAAARKRPEADSFPPQSLFNKRAYEKDREDDIDQLKV